MMKKSITGYLVIESITIVNGILLLYVGHGMYIYELPLIC